MTAISSLSVREIESAGIAPELLRRLLGRAVWQWYREHQDDVVFARRILFFKIELRVRDVRFLIERIAGPEVF